MKKAVFNGSQMLVNLRWEGFLIKWQKIQAVQKGGESLFSYERGAQ